MTEYAPDYNEDNCLHCDEPCEGSFCSSDCERAYHQECFDDDREW